MQDFFKVHWTENMDLNKLIASVGGKRWGEEGQEEEEDEEEREEGEKLWERKFFIILKHSRF